MWTFPVAFFFQRDTAGLSAENTELKLQLQAMELQAQLRDGEHFNYLFALNAMVELSCLYYSAAEKMITVFVVISSVAHYG